MLRCSRKARRFVVDGRSLAGRHSARSLPRELGLLAYFAFVNKW